VFASSIWKQAVNRVAGPAKSINEANKDAKVDKGTAIMKLEDYLRALLLC